MREEPVLLGLLPEHREKIAAPILEKLEFLARVDLGFEKTSFVARHPDEAAYIELLERELKRFLSLTLLVSERESAIAPSVRIDEFWHEVILNTPRYRSLCDTVYGAYLDHVPNQDELVRESTRRAEGVAEFTNAMLTKYYGDLDLAIWGSEIMRPCYPPPPPAVFVGTGALEENPA